MRYPNIICCDAKYKYIHNRNADIDEHKLYRYCYHVNPRDIRFICIRGVVLRCV